jgi:hypothetical protein
MAKTRKVKATKKNTEIYELRNEISQLNQENSQLKRQLIDMTNAWKSVRSMLNALENPNDSRRRNNNTNQQEKLED